MRTETCDEETITVVYYKFKKAVEEIMGDELSSIFVEGVNHNPKTNVAYFTDVDHPSERNKTYEKINIIATSKDRKKIIEVTPLKPNKIKVHVILFETINKNRNTLRIRGDAIKAISNAKQLKPTIEELLRSAEEKIAYQTLRLA